MEEWEEMIKKMCPTGKAHILCDVSLDSVKSLEICGDRAMIFASICEIIRDAALSDQSADPKVYVRTVCNEILMELENEPAGGNRTGSGTE